MKLVMLILGGATLSAAGAVWSLMTTSYLPAPRELIAVAATVLVAMWLMNVAVDHEEEETEE